MEGSNVHVRLILSMAELTYLLPCYIKAFLFWLPIVVHYASAAFGDSPGGGGGGGGTHLCI